MSTCVSQEVRPPIPTDSLHSQCSNFSVTRVTVLTSGHVVVTKAIFGTYLQMFPSHQSGVSGGHYGNLMTAGVNLLLHRKYKGGGYADSKKRILQRTKVSVLDRLYIDAMSDSSWQSYGELYV